MGYRGLAVLASRPTGLARSSSACTVHAVGSYCRSNKSSVWLRRAQRTVLHLPVAREVLISIAWLKSLTAPCHRPGIIAARDGAATSCLSAHRVAGEHSFTERPVLPRGSRGNGSGSARQSGRCRRPRQAKPLVGKSPVLS